ncbi:DUF2254 domain-containing protein [Oceanicella actignis]|uniref:DUF2254 domain-containing protein n=1 Tax=Oceanicella actignis TaxID=1189325 RepID=UPI00125A8915|nr:DUF2254 domain-containing protein [Oceanicella actignis]TYO89601.1 putative membrane protein [Oceanicella actignis]
MHLGAVRLREAAIELRGSYWFIPASLVLAAVALSLLLGWADRHPRVAELVPEGLFSARPEDARATLGVIASAAIGVAGVAFSITIVAVTFASGQHGPRLIGNFMRDRGAQWSLGILMAAFVYALMTLRAVEGAGPENGGHAFVPQISIGAALLLSLLSVGTTIYFFHHIPDTIDIANLVAALGRRLCARVVRPDLPAPESTRGLRPERTLPAWEVTAAQPGYVRAVDPEGIARIALDCAARVTLLAPPGSFVSAIEPAFRVEGAPPSDELADALRKTIAIGEGKTEEQNTLFLVEQLVEVAARALSPGVNDPFTAVYCMNWLHAALIARLEAGAAACDQEEGLVVLPQLSWPALLSASLGACLPYARPDPIASAALGKLLDRLEACTEGEDRAAVARLVRELARAEPRRGA